MQVNPDFLTHLQQKNLEQERLTYYHCIDFSKDSSLSLSKDIAYLATKYNDTILLNKYPQFARDTNDLVYILYGAIVLNQEHIYAPIFDELKYKNLSSDQLAQLLELMNCWQGIVEEERGESLFYTTKERIKKLQTKSIFLASLMSFVIPGSGKYYLLQQQEATSTFILNMIALAPFLETTFKIGMLSTAGVLSGLVLVPIYFANVYGTYISKKVLLKKLKLQLKNEVLDYCTYQLRN